MDCKESEENLIPYLLGTLGPEEIGKMASHVDACAACAARLRQESEIVEELTYAVPQLPVPPGVKQRLMSTIDAEVAGDRPAGAFDSWSGLFTMLGRRLVAHSGLAVASTLIVAVVGSGVWYDGHLDQVAREKEQQVVDTEVSTFIEAGGEYDAEMVQMVEEQRHLQYMSIEPGVSVSMLKGTGMSAQARGMIVIPPTSDAALLAVLQLPPLPIDKVYQVWLIKSGGMYSVGTFKVDSTGSGQTKIELIAPLHDLEAIVITVERAGGSPGPTGESVLMGGL